MWSLEYLHVWCTLSRSLLTLAQHSQRHCVEHVQFSLKNFGVLLSVIWLEEEGEDNEVCVEEFWVLVALQLNPRLLQMIVISNEENMVLTISNFRSKIILNVTCVLSNWVVTNEWMNVLTLIRYFFCLNLTTFEIWCQYFFWKIFLPVLNMHIDWNA